MPPKRFVSGVLATGILGLGCFLQMGCADESKTTGTMLQLTEKDRAEIEGMRAAMKGQRSLQNQQNNDRRRRQ